MKYFPTKHHKDKGLYQQEQPDKKKKNNSEKIEHHMVGEYELRPAADGPLLLLFGRVGSATRHK
jgi:hypothetical protein